MFVTEPFMIRGITIVVHYNTYLYTRKDIKRMLKSASRNYDEFCEIQSEMEILNEADVIEQLFKGEE